MINNKDCWLKDHCNKCKCNEFCIRLFKLDYLYSEALIPLSSRYHRVLFLDKDNTDMEEFKKLASIEKNITQYINEGKNIYIHSSICGNGKSSWAFRFVESYFNCIWPKCDLGCKALFISVPKLLLALKDNISEKSDYIQHIKNNINIADVVIWDDIATKQTTQFESEHLLSMIDSRLTSGKSNIYTSNLSDEELHKALGDRLASRICNMSENIELHGLDKRGL